MAAPGTTPSSRPPTQEKPRKKQYPPCGFDKLARLLDAPKLRAWFVMDHDRHENDAWVLHPKLLALLRKRANRWDVYGA